MKNFVILLPAIMLVLMASCKPSVKEAIAYNESIVNHHVDIDKKVAFLSDTYDNYVPLEMDTAYAAALKAAQDGIDFANKLEPFHGDESFKKGAQELFEAYKSALTVEHARIIELLKLPPEKYQQKEINEFDKLKESAEKKINGKIDEVSKIQAEFAKKFNFEIDEQKTE